MTREVVYLPEVSRDYLGAQRYYETISPGTGERFQAAFNKAEHEIEAGLITHHVDFTHYHRVNLHRFPYAMFYRLHESMDCCCRAVADTTGTEKPPSGTGQSIN